MNTKNKEYFYGYEFHSEHDWEFIIPLSGVDSSKYDDLANNKPLCIPPSGEYTWKHLHNI